MRVKKLIALFVTSIIILTCSGCGNIQNESKSTLGEQQESDRQQSDDIVKTRTEITLDEIPNEYFDKANEEGHVVHINYDTNSYDEDNQSYSKYAFVYLPYGYDETDTEKKYDIFYLMHGGGGTADRYLGGENGDLALKRIFDHMIENGDMKPMIVVTPTFYSDNSSDSSVSTAGELTAKFHNELINDLVPAVESTYHTYAETTDEAGLQASREHRAFGGFSMGSVTTWYTFIYCLDYFKYYMPISGDCWIMGQQAGATHPKETAGYLNNVAIESGYTNKDYYIYAATGTDDIAYKMLSSQIEAMKSYTDTFIYNSDFTKGNIYFGVVPGGVHNNIYMNQYIYNALPKFFI